MLKSKLNLALVTALLLVGIAFAVGQNPTPLLTKSADEWIAVLKSDATQKEKVDACRQLAVIGTPEAVSALVALLPDEKMNHMARYALEMIPGPSVDQALRAALGSLKGRPLVGVIGSLGVRRDAQAIGTLAQLLADADADVAQAAARALGKIGTPAAAKAIQNALPKTPAGNQLAFCEGLFRCAEALSATGQRDAALGIYDWLRTVQPAPHQVRAGALRGAILTRGSAGLALMLQAIRGDDFVLVDAAARTALEMPGADVTKALAAELGQLSADKQILFIQVLGKRADAGAIPAVFALAKNSEKRVRLAAVRGLPEFAHPSTVPMLVELMGEADREIAQAAQEGLAGVPGPEADAAVMAMFNSRDTSQRLAGLDLIARRRMTSAIPALLQAAADPDAKVRPAAVRRLGELAGPADLPALLDLLMQAKGAPELDAAEQAVSAVCVKAGNPESSTAKLASLMAQAQPAQKGALLRVLSALGGSGALKAVRAAVDDPNQEVHAAAIRALGDWKTADAAPDLLALAQKASDPNDRMLCLRSYLGLAAQPELPAGERLSMCQKAAGLLQSNQEKKMLLGTLGGIATPESLAVIVPYLEDAGVKDEAGAAALAIADRLLQGRNAAKFAPKLVEPLQKVAQANVNADLTRRANALLQQAQSRARRP